MHPTWFSLVPPLVVVVGACVMRQLNYAILCGIVVAALLVQQGDILASVLLIADKIWTQVTTVEMLYLYCFLICIPALIQVFIITKSAAAFTRFIVQRLKSPQLVELACCVSSMVLSIDDYLSILTVGNVMRITVDHVGIAREKLAYLIHSLSGAVVIMCPISSWVATICVYLHQSGISNIDQSSIVFADPFSIYFHTIPYMLYSILTVVSVIVIVTKKFSFGPMAWYEKSIRALYIPRDEQEQVSGVGRVTDLMMPLSMLLVLIILGILYGGDFYLFGGRNSLLDAFKSNTHIFLILAVSGIVALSSALGQALCKHHITVRAIPTILYSGFQLMRTILMMIFLISILSSFLKNELFTGQYLAEVISRTTTVAYVPGIMFLLALIMSLATGSSWGTFGLLLPIAVPMVRDLCADGSSFVISEISLLYPVLGAIFSGAVCGDHISLFSETTLMAASCAQIEPITHFKTQLAYAVPAVVGSFMGFVMMGILYSHGMAVYWPSAVCAMTTCVALLIILQKKYQ